MEEYKSNSNKSRESTPPISAQKQAGQPEHRVQKVATGSVKPKSNLKKFAQTVIQENLRSAKSYAWKQVIFPAIQDTFISVVSILVYGEPGHVNRPSRSSSVIRRSYDKDWDRNRNAQETVRPSNAFDSEDIVFNTYGEAEYVLDELRRAIRNYDIARVLDLYDACDLTPPSTGFNFGWTNLDNVKPTRMIDGSGYYLPMPRPMPID